MWAERHAGHRQRESTGAPRLTEINSLPPSDRTVYYLNSFLHLFIPKYSSGLVALRPVLANNG